MSNWQTFPHDSSRYDYAGDALRAHWEQLHRGDREHYPIATTSRPCWTSLPGAATQYLLVEHPQVGCSRPGACTISVASAKVSEQAVKHWGRLPSPAPPNHWGFTPPIWSTTKSRS